MTIITTEDHLASLSAGEVVFDADGDWMVKGDDGAMHQMMAQDEPSPCHLPALPVRPDQPVSAAPTVEQIAEVVLREYHSRSAPSSSRAFAAHVAEAIAALYPTCQPSREAAKAVTDAVREMHRHAPHEGAPGWIWCHGCRHSVSADAGSCPTVRLCDEIDKAAGVQR